MLLFVLIFYCFVSLFTQTGPLPTTYRWRGRNATTDRELNPKVYSMYPTCITTYTICITVYYAYKSVYYVYNYVYYMYNSILCITLYTMCITLYTNFTLCV